MSRGTLEDMLQLPSVQFSPQLNSAYKVVGNAFTFLLSDRRSRWRGTCCPPIFTSNISFRLLGQLKNLTSVWECIHF